MTKEIDLTRGLEGSRTGLWALRFLTIVIVGVVPMFIGIILAALGYSTWWLVLIAPFCLGIAGVIIVLGIEILADIFQEAWGWPK